MKMLSLYLQPVAIYRGNPFAWKSSAQSTCHNLLSISLRLSCKSIYSKPSSRFGGFSLWVPRRRAISTHAKKKSSKPEVVKGSSPVQDDILSGLNEISNEAVKAMARHDSKAIEELKDKVNYLERYLVEEGETDAAKFMLIIAGMLDHMVPAEKDELSDVYKAALKKMWNIVEDSGWILKFENEETMQEMVDDDLIPPVLNGPY
ncbi:hypothetical protein KI387_015078 [Taxus chinensis]|uniref:Uncharacterized protein n=1 Tax=Taxus chinensis TaxID=29808 RepID=A0AA38GBV1_TAXCH|nr:hypothetical protein KI387_015078 [Taxus chinensis]